MRFVVAMLGFVALAGCQSGGQDGYGDYLRERGGASSSAGYSPITGGPVSSAPLGATAAGSVAPASGQRISDEQDFDAVAARESIESDRERLERQREQYVFIEPTPLPQRAGDGPNLVQYALNTRNNVGETVHRRLNPLRWSRWEQNCAQFATQDQAQIAFLARGGPERDSGNLDPDGDGFACWWNPAPYRGALR